MKQPPSLPPSRTNTRHALRWSLTSLAIGLVLPSLIIFSVEVFVGGISPFTSIANVLGRQFSDGNNLYLIAAFGLIPFAAFSIACFVAARQLSSPRLNCVAVGGLLGILLLMIPGHVAVWYPLYSPGHASSTAVIAFLFIPFYCLATLGVGLFAGWLVSRLPRFLNATGVS